MSEEIVEEFETVLLGAVGEQKFLDYATYVIFERALPDIRDGLKPVHRRILWAQHVMGNHYNKPYKKSARIVGDVIGKYHPHGDTAVYDTLVRMAQPFSLRANLVDGQGNFGSIDGDNPAAMRYTESRQTKFSDSMFDDIDKETVRMVDNYDGTEQMPEVLPVRFPNLLINGTQGIAVGMAANIPTHNPIEVMECVKYLYECRGQDIEPEIDHLLTLLPAPDFPTGGIVHGLSDMRDIWLTGRGKMRLRAKWHEEQTTSGRSVLVITEIPYQVKKEALMEKIIELANPDKKKGGKVEVEGLSAIRDESAKDIRIVIELKRDFEADIIFNTLLKHSMLEISISYNPTVLVNGKPEVVGLLSILQHYVLFREEVIVKRTEYLDRKAASRSFLLEGLTKALDALDQVIELIKKSATPADAVASLMDFLSLDEVQARHIIEMRLSRLTSSQREDLLVEITALQAKRDEYAKILTDEEYRLSLMSIDNDEQLALFASTPNVDGHYTYGKRLTATNHLRINSDLAALTKEEPCTILYTSNGYLRRMPTENLAGQNRGTRGKRHMKLKEGDYIQQSLSSHSHDSLLIITERGHVYGLKAYDIPDIEKGRFISNVIEIPETEKVLMIVPVDLADEDQFLTMVTEKGYIKRTSIADYQNSFRKSGLIGIDLRENDKIVFSGTCCEDDDIALVNNNNLIIRFNVNRDSLRPLKRSSMGVKGMELNEQVSVIGGAIVSSDEAGYLVCITMSGMVKITPMGEYRVQKRAGKGLRAFRESDKTGKLFKSLIVRELDGDLITTTKNGVTNRIALNNISVTGRTTSGVKLVKLDDNDAMADVFSVLNDDAEELSFEDVSTEEIAVEDQDVD
jgi:DNA gyrase subunit A